MWHVRSIALILSLATAFTPEARADTTLLREATGLMGVAMWLDSGAPGMVLVVVRGQETLVQGYGETTKGNGKEPDGRSLLRLGSISKVLATELLAGMAAAGQLRLPIRCSNTPLRRSPCRALATARSPCSISPRTPPVCPERSARFPRTRSRSPGRPRQSDGPFSPATNCLGRPAPSPPTPMSASICLPMRSPTSAARSIQACCVTG